MWKPLARAAATAPNGRFTIALSELEYDDPFSVILTYDPRLSQPWSRVEVQREIVDLTYVPFGQGELVPAALSNEGDVYLLTDEVQRTKIPGAGINSEDADGRGQVWQICAIGTALFVGGESGQLYQSNAQGWKQIEFPLMQSAIVALEPLADGRLLIAGQEIAQNRPDFSQMNTAEDIMAMVNSQLGKAETGAGRSIIYVYDGTDFVEVPSEPAPHIRGVASGNNGELLVFGVNDLLLLGDVNGLIRQALPRRGLTYLTGAIFNEQIWLGSDHALHRWVDGELITSSPSLDPLVSNGQASPLYICLQDNQLIYFDYRQGVYIFDGTAWSGIRIPTALLKRTFDTLAPRE